MNARSVLLIVVALIMAGGTALLVRNFIGANQRQAVEVQAPQKTEGPRILVANANLPTGTILNAEHYSWQTWPEAQVADSYIERGSLDEASLPGRVLRFPVMSGAPLTQSNMVAPGERGFMAAVLQPGMRAVTVPITNVSGVAGFVFPGDHVDLILTHRVNDADGMERQVSETVVQNVRILAVDTRTNDTDNQPAVGKTVTVEVTPKLAETLQVLQRLGTISLALRSLADTEMDAESLTPTVPTNTTKTRTWDAEASDLLPPVDPAKARVEVKVNRGGATTIVEFKPEDVK